MTRKTSWEPSQDWIKAAALSSAGSLAQGQPSTLAALIYGLSLLGNSPLDEAWIAAFDKVFRAKQQQFTASDIALVLIAYYQHDHVSAPLVPSCLVRLLLAPRNTPRAHHRPHSIRPSLLPPPPAPSICLADPRLHHLQRDRGARA
jgi:hypothetical protein